MLDSIAGSAAFLGGVEIVNDARTVAYLNNGLKPGTLSVEANCGCPDLYEIIGCEPVTGGYTDPATDNAPWYSEDHPESADFAGFFMTDFDGMSSTFQRSVTESVGNGGLFNRGRAASRELTWTGYLFGANCCAVAYGLRWLTKVLQGGTQCIDCFGDDLELLVCCPSPEAASGVPGIEAFRTLKSVALTEGPVILSERRLGAACDGASGCGGSAVIEIEFTLTAAKPWFYRSEIPVVNCVPLSDGVPRYTLEGVECPPVDCGTEFLNAYIQTRGCELSELPPAGSYSIACLEQPGTLDTATYITASRSLWRDFEEVVPYIVIDTGNFYITDLEISFYTSNNDNPCGELALDAPNCDPTCDKLRILALPSNSKFYIDGRTQTMSLVCESNVAFPGEKFTRGPFSWPSFSCYGFCMEIAYSLDSAGDPDPPIALPNLGTGCVSLSLIPRAL